MEDETINGHTTAEAPYAGDADSAAVADAATALAALAAERDQLLRDNAELRDQLLRRLAEFDNFRKRTERERSELIEYAAQEALKALLPVLDNFERALCARGTGEEFARGMELIHQQLLETVKKLGLDALDAEGQPFDPNFHMAVERIETNEAGDQTILADLQRGYLYKGRLLRPSMVRVAVEPGS